MTKLRWTTQAVKTWKEGVERLELFPRSGRVVPELADPQLRKIIESPYRIVCRVFDESVEILTVFRASRLLRSAFED